MIKIILIKSTIITDPISHLNFNRLYIFFAELLWLMRWLYRSWTAAVILVFSFAIILFHGDRHFFDPSSSILRYPLLIISAWLLSIWIVQPNSFKNKLALSSSLALSIFFNTETGIITVLSVILAALLQEQGFLKKIASLCWLGIITFAVFLLLMLTVFPGFRT